jgi:hypothetical protein
MQEGVKEELGVLFVLESVLCYSLLAQWKSF